MEDSLSGIALPGSIVAAWVFAVFLAVVVLFQLALAAGAPWGEVSMGGRFPGRYPPFLRFVCLLQVVVLVLLGLIVFARAGIVLPEWHAASRRLVWGVVAFSAVAVVANLLTPSKWERILWAPVAVVLLASSLVVALG